MAEDVAGPVDARPLAVPHAENAVVLAFTAQLGLLRTPNRGRRQIFVDPALEADVAFLKKGLGTLELAVEAAKRRAAISGNKTRGIETVPPIELFLHQAETNQSLKSGHEHAALAEVVFVVELYVTQRHLHRLQSASLPLQGRYCQRAGHAEEYRARRPWSNASGLKRQVFYAAMRRAERPVTRRGCAAASVEAAPGLPPPAPAG